MKKKLYNTSGNIKLDLIEKALKEARREGNLPNVPSSDIRHFIESLEEEMEKYKSKVGTQINRREMKFLFKRMMLNSHDKITDRELGIIEEILLDKDFEIG
ncbi:MAG: hypothetical protein KAQ64_01575 [Candidatus Pacebacteria bacterium]|nr:hypothetical protein [Candidatus Paceibacterota bacterium]